MIKTFIIACMILLLTGCAGSIQGLLYKNVIRPHSTNFENTPIGTKRAFLDEYKVSEPFSGFKITAEWSTDAIKAEAIKAGITNIAYTDEQTLSILFGLYRRRRLIIYGD
ncbi:MAG: hypothetical protein ACE5HN_06315 [Nitrospiria bacterium]